MPLTASSLLVRMLHLIVFAGLGHICPLDSSSYFSDKMFLVPLFLLYFLTLHANFACKAIDKFILKIRSYNNISQLHWKKQCYIPLCYDNLFSGSDMHPKLCSQFSLHNLSQSLKTIDTKSPLHTHELFSSISLYSYKIEIFHKHYHLPMTNGS